jgi:large subunit ribosomal protein L4
MTSAHLLDIKGKKVGDVKLDQTVFGIEPNVDVLHSAVVRQLGNARSGCASTKTRSEVAGGGRKPWRQKGTGRARAGSIRSPLWAGGGVTFGPKPRDYYTSMPKKVRQLALKSALSARKDALTVVDDFASIRHGKTKAFAEMLKHIEVASKKVLLVLDMSKHHSLIVERAARNIDALKVVDINNLNVKDILNCDHLLIDEPTINAVSARFQPATEGKEKAPKKKATKEKASKKVAKASKKVEGKTSKKAATKAKAPKKEKKSGGTK